MMTTSAPRLMYRGAFCSRSRLRFALQFLDGQIGDPLVDLRFDPGDLPADLASAREFPVAHPLPDGWIRNADAVHHILTRQQPRPDDFFSDGDCGHLALLDRRRRGQKKKARSTRVASFGPLVFGSLAKLPKGKHVNAPAGLPCLWHMARPWPLWSGEVKVEFIYHFVLERRNPFLISIPSD